MVLDRQLLPTTPIDFDPAKVLLCWWLKEHHYRVDKDTVFTDVTYCDYGDRHFWSCRHKVFNGNKGIYQTLGFHIYDTGEARTSCSGVTLVSRE